MIMAASLGISHEATTMSYSSSAASSYFPDPVLFADSCAAVLDFDDAGVPPPGYGYYSPPPPVVFPGAGCAETNEANLSCAGGGGGGRRSSSASGRIGFRTRSEVDVLDDGFKWRKYGKKAVKSSPNPRNYYRCSAEGCGVKKRVERDSGDPRYVVTTYDGVHNHATPTPGAGGYLGHSPAAPAPAWGAPPPAAGLAAPMATTGTWRAPVQSHTAAATAYSSESSY